MGCQCSKENVRTLKKREIIKKPIPANRTIVNTDTINKVYIPDDLPIDGDTNHIIYGFQPKFGLTLKAENKSNRDSKNLRNIGKKRILKRKRFEANSLRSSYSEVVTSYIDVSNPESLEMQGIEEELNVNDILIKTGYETNEVNSMVRANKNKEVDNHSLISQDKNLQNRNENIV